MSIYDTRRNNTLRIRRQVGGGYSLQCDNGAYPAHEIESLRKAGLTVLGRVLMTLRPSRI